MASTASVEQEGGGTVPITSLSVQELSRLRDGLQEEVEHLIDSHNLLGRAATRSEAAAKAIGTLAESKPDQPLLLPLTGSLYVKGKIASTDKLLVNIGTDYYVEMATEQATDYCNRKQVFLEKQQKGIQKAVQERKSHLGQVAEVLRGKMAAMQAAEAGSSKSSHK